MATPLERLSRRHDFRWKVWMVHTLGDDPLDMFVLDDPNDADCWNEVARPDDVALADHPANVGFLLETLERMDAPVMLEQAGTSWLASGGDSGARADTPCQALAAAILEVLDGE